MYRLLIVFSIQLCYSDKLFDLDADDIFQSMVGNITGNSYQQSFDAFKRTLTKGDKSKNRTSKVTTRPFPLTKYTPKKPVSELTLDDINKRRMNINLARLINETNPIPDFTRNADDPSVQTRRFDAIRRKITDLPKESLRQIYLYYENGTALWIQKNKLVALMQHYVYETRYKLPYSQLMRVKYKNELQYKLGYAFSLLRHLKQQQRNIYSSYKTHHMTMLTMHFHAKMYEKVTRLDVDIRDVIRLIKEIEKKRREALEYDDK